MSAFDSVVCSKARPLPVIVLADNSGSMYDDGKLDSLKHALTEMITSFKDASSSALDAEIYVSIVSFGNNSVSMVIEPKSASEIANNQQLMKAIDEMRAAGNTPLGLAISKLVDMLEHRESYPSRAYRPFLILASDGMPNDEWEGPLKKLLFSERGKKATRLALSIGVDADNAMLEKFIDNKEIPVFKANDVYGIRRFFKCVTMSAIKSSQSARPGEITTGDVVKILSDDDDDLFKD